MLKQALAQLLKNPRKLKVLAQYRDYVFSSFEVDIAHMRNYLQKNKGIWSKLFCAVLNTIYFCFKRNNETELKFRSNRNTSYFLTDLLQYAVQDQKPKFEKQNLSCTVIVPVYNGLEHLQRLLPSLERNTNPTAKILIINDCSSDSRISVFLKQFEFHDNFLIINNESNLGFVKTINKAMSLVKTDFAVWLNSDTIVPNYWLERLLSPFKYNSRIASATPFSNSAVTFSYPHFGMDNDLSFDLDEIDSAFRRIEPTNDLQENTYSGTGFCMAINMSCWKDIGPLDENAFGKGYGEENDWCMRATINGWNHRLVSNLFVQHSHGGSFLSAEKKKLCQEHQAVLASRYPKIMSEDVPNFFNTDPWKPFRDLASLLLSDKNLTVYIDLASHRNDISGALDYSKYLLSNLKNQGERIIVASYERFTDNWSLSPISVDKDCSIKLKDFREIKWLFNFLNVKKVIINNLVFLNTPENVIATICHLKKKKGFLLEYRWHDNLSICPSFFLLTSENYPCCITDVDRCKVCLPKNVNRTLNRNNIEDWRSFFNYLFCSIDKVYFFSEYSLKIALSIYPQLKDKYLIVEHKPLINKEDLTYKFQRVSEDLSINIAFVGTFSQVKGSEYFNKLTDDLVSFYPKAKFYIFGRTDGSEKKGINCLGEYRRSDLGMLLTKYHIHLVVYPSVANETFSYTAQELMLLRVPLVVFPCGAPAERIRKYGYVIGEIADTVSEQALLQATIKLIKKITSTQMKIS